MGGGQFHECLLEKVGGMGRIRKIGLLHDSGKTTFRIRVGGWHSYVKLCLNSVIFRL